MLKRHSSLLFLVVGVWSFPALAGQYFQDFNSFAPGATNFSDGSALHSTALGGVAAVADTGLKELALTDAAASNTRSAFLLPDLDPGQSIAAFSAKWNVLVSGNFPTAGSGYSFNFGDLRGTNLISDMAAQENGYFNASCLSVSFRTLNNTPGIYLRVNGTNVVASATNTPATFWGVNSGARHFFEVDWDADSGLTLRMNGSTIFSNIATTGFTPAAGHSFVFAARTSTATETLRLDNLAVVTGGKLVPLAVTAPFYFSAEAPGQEAAKAFDGSSSTTWRDAFNLTAALGGTVNNTVRCYVVNNGVYTSPFGGAVATWQFQGGDGVNWSSFGDASVQFANTHENRAFVPVGGGSLPAWRLSNIQNGDNSVGIGLGELTFYGLQTIGVPAVTNVQAPVSSFPWLTISASVHPQGLATTVIFEFGTNTSYGWSATNSLASTDGSTPLSVNIGYPLLERQVPLYYRVRASNLAGTTTVTGQTSSQGFRMEASDWLEDVFVMSVPIPGGGNVDVPYGNLLQTGTENGRFMDYYNEGRLDLALSGVGLFSRDPGHTTILGNDVPEFRSGLPDEFGYRVAPFGSFRYSTVSDWGRRGAMAIADLNGDNGPDLVCPAGPAGSDPNEANPGPVTIKGSRSPWSAPRNLGFFDRVNAASSTTPFLLLDNGRVVLADFDNDGKTDALMTGVELTREETQSGPSTDSVASFAQLYRNVGQSGNLTVSMPMGQVVSPVGLIDVACTLESADLDGDGYPEVYQYVNSGTDGRQISRIYRNDREMGLVPWQELPIVGSPIPVSSRFRGSSAAFADFNGDGHVDLVTAGEGDLHGDFNGSILTRILFNDGTGILTNSGINLPPMTMVSLAVGDVFNHGRNDIVIAGASTSFVFQTTVLRNDGGSFTPVDFGLRPIGSHIGHGLDLGDYDEDGRLDLLAVGGSPQGPVTDSTTDSTTVYWNTLDIPTNQPPGAPSALASSVGPGIVLLSWTNAVDDITPKNLLNYNVYITTVPGTEVRRTNAAGEFLSHTNLIKVSPMADFVTGKRKVPQPGNVRHAYRHEWRLPPGTYYWSVQAIDGAYAGGPWAPEQTFTITEPERPPLAAAYTNSGTLLRWSGRFPEFQLEQKTTLNDAQWTTNSLPTVLTNGKLAVTITNTPPSSFFRLRRP